MDLVIGFAHRTGIRLAEVGFLLMLFAGIWLAAADILPWARFRRIVAGLALAVGAALLIVAIRWGQFS
jgi:hypothetical protein